MLINLYFHSEETKEVIIQILFIGVKNVNLVVEH